MQKRQLRYWTVSYRTRPGTHTGKPLTTPAVVRRHHAAMTAQGRADVTLTEHLMTRTESPITVTDLPGPGEPTPLPPLPATAHEVRRYFRCADYGPPVLPTGDRVRSFLAWVADVRERHPAGPRLIGASRYPDPATLRVRDVRVVISQRQITPDQLPA
ncbi:hypothetical protein [Streptomyces sp. NPDC048442]|uniref:hypothetical protein n=1 Tax=Streptomyces sp. NPDC048442 TaxID=3154823 RepID=UPI003431798F